jgi:hypothetical protein
MIIDQEIESVPASTSHEPTSQYQIRHYFRIADDSSRRSMASDRIAWNCSGYFLPRSAPS